MFHSTTTAARAATGAPPLPARAAVETVRAGSAGLSASYYAMLGLTVHPLAAVGLGLVAGAADYVKGNALAAVVDGPGLTRRLVALPLFAVLFVASMIAVDGVLLKLRGNLVSGPAAAISAHDRASADHKAAVAELATLAGVRAPDAIRADMDAAPVTRAVFRRTNECTDITKDESLAACQPLLALRKEMATAIRKRELEAARDTAARRLEDLGPRPTSADPQAETLAALLAPYGVPEAAVAYGLIAIVGFAIELAACFGLYVLGHRPATPANENRPSAVGIGQPKRQQERPALTGDHPAGLSDADVATLRARFFTPDVPDDQPDGPKPGARIIPLRQPDGRTEEGRKAAVLRSIRADLDAGRSYPSQSELCRTFGVPRSTLSDWLADWESSGAIPPRRTVGRCKRLAAG